MKHTITEASRLAGISRTNMYKHIKEGSISVEKDKLGKPYIETSELIRVFDLNNNERNSVQPSTDTMDAKNTEINYLKQLIQEKDTQLQKTELREARLVEEVEYYRALLEHKTRRNKGILRKIIDTITNQ